MRQITSFVWLAIGGVFATLCLGKGAVPFAAWLAPIFLLRFARITPPFAGLLLIFHRCLKLPKASSQTRNHEHRASSHAGEQQTEIRRTEPTTDINAGITEMNRANRKFRANTT
jgi:hypothetical protein